MIYPGLVSVSFRALPPAEVITLARSAALAGIEWGGDIHVPPGDTVWARQVGVMTREAGLAVASYGSYYRVGEAASPEHPPFEAVLAAAVALGAPVIRVWAGRRASADADDAHWQAVVEDAHRIADMAAAAGVRVAFEYHGGTLTDTSQAACALMRRADHPHLGCYWQPPVAMPTAQALQGLRAIAPWLGHVHVFHWQPGTERKPLEQGVPAWRQYLRIIGAQRGDRFALLEFIAGDDSQQLLRDAATLHRLLGEHA